MSRLLKCRFCEWTTPKICVEDGDFLDINHAHYRLKEHVKEHHPEEYQALQQWAASEYRAIPRTIDHE